MLKSLDEKEICAIGNNTVVTKEHVKAYVEELKQNLDGIWTKEQKEKLLSGFASEDDYHIAQSQDVVYNERKTNDLQY